MSDPITQLVLSFVMCAPCVALLLGVGPPVHGSWWYPDPGRWDYQIKLSLYAILDANAPTSARALRFSRAMTAAVLAVMLAIIWVAT